MTRYRKTFRAALEEVYLSEKEISKLKNGVKVLGNALPNRMIAQKAADKANKEMGVDADVYQSPFNNRFYVRIKEENISEQEKDHEISMARGELEAIADKAIKLSSMLQGKSDDGNPLEAWVQSKITKAKDYINSVSDYMEYNPENANEETILEFTSQQIKMAYGILNDPRYKQGNYDGAVKAIEKLAKGLSKHPDVANALKRANEEVELEEGVTPAMIAMLKKEYEPFRGKTITAARAKQLMNILDKFKDDDLKKLSTQNIPFISSGSKSKLVVRNMKFKVTEINPFKEETDYLEETFELIEGKMSQIHAMMKDGKSAAEIAKVLKLDYKTVKDILGEKVEEAVDKKEKEKTPAVEPDVRSDGEKEVKKEDDKEKLKAELEKKDDEIAMLKTKAETEKAKVMKKETEKLVNPETGEPLLQVGVAYKHIRDKMQKEETIVEFTSQQIKMAYGILNDPRYKQGNYTGAVKAIEKLAKGLSKHPDVANALKRANESLDEMAKDKAYAIGMSTAKKKHNDEPPLEKKTIKKGHEIADKLMGMKKEETIKEFKKMTVTFKTMDKMAKASTDLAKHGFTIHAKGLVMKVDGKGDDLNKYATDLKNFYGATVKAEENAMSLTDLERMKKTGLKTKKEETKHDLAKMKFEQIAGLKKKAEKSGMPYGILKKVYDRGMAAWRGGHRPGASQQQWAFARVNSFVTKSSGTWGGADKDLAAKVKGSKK